MPRDMMERQFEFFCQPRETRIIADHQRRVRLELLRHEGVEAMRLLRDHDGETLAAVVFGEAYLDFHAQLRRELRQARAERIRVQRTAFPRGLERHAELAARDLLLQRLDV